MRVAKTSQDLDPMSSRFSQQLGLLRSFLMYYAHPLRTRTLARVYTQFIHPGDLCFDIGAHLGNHLRIWSQLGARTVALEPQPQCIRLLRYWYGADPQITLLEQAVSDVPGRQPLFISQRTPTVSTLFRDWIQTVEADSGFANVRWDRKVEVEVTTLDRLIAQHGEPAFCKIDVEGGELAVLSGLSVPLRSLSFEYLAVAMDRAVRCIERLRELGEYEYNWSPREGEPLQSAKWLSPVEMSNQLRHLVREGGSGDVYARRCD